MVLQVQCVLCITPGSWTTSHHTLRWKCPFEGSSSSTFHGCHQVGISLSLLLIATGALLYIQVYYQLLFIFALQSIVLNIGSTLSPLHTFLQQWEILMNGKLLSSWLVHLCPSLLKATVQSNLMFCSWMKSALIQDWIISWQSSFIIGWNQKKEMWWPSSTGR